MIKDFKTYIEESRLARNLRNSFSDDLRNDDKSVFHDQIKNMEWVDLGLPSGRLWSSVELHDQYGDDFLTYLEVKDDYMNDLFEFPLTTDFNELKKCCDINKLDNGIFEFVSKKNGNKIIFKTYKGHHFNSEGYGFKTIELDDIKHQVEMEWACVSKAGNPHFSAIEGDEIFKPKPDLVGKFANRCYLIRPVKDKNK